MGKGWGVAMVRRRSHSACLLRGDSGVVKRGRGNGTDLTITTDQTPEGLERVEGKGKVDGWGHTLIAESTITEQG